MINQSAYKSEYVIQPPDFPEFLFKRSMKPFEALIEWSRKEYQARLKYCAEHGYLKAFRFFNEEYSPYRILAELHGFRKYCSYLPYNPNWAAAGNRIQTFIIRSYKLRDILFREN